ncbi:MAG: hypothetical protein IJR44_06835 [Neisseriaceae bacterium]|nr:hypothetical protein [Neisseriaceae bacterium]
MTKKEYEEIRSELVGLQIKLENIEDNQQVLILQNLFILEYLMGDAAKQQELKERLGGMFDSVVEND